MTKYEPQRNLSLMDETQTSDLPYMIIYGDGVRDDTEALQAYINGKAQLIYPNGKLFKNGAFGEAFVLKPLIFR